MAVLVLLAVAGCGRCPPPPDAVPSSLDAHLLARDLSAAGLDATPLDAISLVLTDSTGVQVVVFVEDAGASLQAVLPYRGPTTAVPAALERWNSTRRFGRAYVDADGAPVLAADLALGPGVTRPAVVAWARLVLAMADRFRHEVWPPPTPPQTGE